LGWGAEWQLLDNCIAKAGKLTAWRKAFEVFDAHYTSRTRRPNCADAGKLLG